MKLGFATAILSDLFLEEEAEGVSGLLLGVAEDVAPRQRLLQLVNLIIGEVQLGVFIGDIFTSGVDRAIGIAADEMHTFAQEVRTLQPIYEQRSVFSERH